MGKHEHASSLRFQWRASGAHRSRRDGPAAGRQHGAVRRDLPHGYGRQRLQLSLKLGCQGVRRHLLAGAGRVGRRRRGCLLLAIPRLLLSLLLLLLPLRCFGRAVGRRAASCSSVLADRRGGHRRWCSSLRRDRLLRSQHGGLHGPRRALQAVGCATLKECCLSFFQTSKALGVVWKWRYWPAARRAARKGQEPRCMPPPPPPSPLDLNRKHSYKGVLLRPKVLQTCQGRPTL